MKALMNLDVGRLEVAARRWLDRMPEIHDRSSANGNAPILASDEDQEALAEVIAAAIDLYGEISTAAAQSKGAASC